MEFFYFCDINSEFQTLLEASPSLNHLRVCFVLILSSLQVACQVGKSTCLTNLNDFTITQQRVWAATSSNRSGM